MLLDQKVEHIFISYIPVIPVPKQSLYILYLYM